MNVKTLLSLLDEKVPFQSAENWDNVGLLIGNPDNEVSGIITTLDCTYEVVLEAMDKGCNTIIAHHPLIFKGMKRIVDDKGYGSILYKLIQNNINLIALHTNLDVHPKGVNAMLAERIGIDAPNILEQNQTTYYKVQVFIPEAHATSFKDAMSRAGLAKEGNYEYAFFSSKGTGQFKPVGEAKPTIGSLEEVENVTEVKIEFMIESFQKEKARALIHEAHPYETPVYDFIPLTKNLNQGLGMIGKLEKSYSVESFINHLKTTLNMPSIRFIGDSETEINTVAIIGGAGIGYEQLAFEKGADVFITGDIKHHEALDAKIAGVNLIDINHYSEHVMKEGLVDLLSEWLRADKSFKIIPSETHTDPFLYY
ncbi:Nif3-like dinuclear metal center hexameric protein [Staphylococcus chromogenes]|uniref:Nif3-like dinuclear metal center hexameric protein n=1 Tax=Staphylococcus chromogenes TaxID=46126 RepID=UPI000D1CA442|nr:Nif3-like dinuclear metal center hexameric protein [Staphylococcus chromogenes]PTF44250.1 Nif3-like dinuclear metal center hexameric protein [Staphylococcus chromogenes]